MKLKSIVALVAVNLFAVAAYGVQFTATSDVCSVADCSTTSTSYTGLSAGTTTIFSNTHPTNEDLRGAVSDGGGDAFDYFGYIANVGSLTLNRQTELLSGNTFRFFDTYTNNTQSTISRTITFVGDLGSDGGTVYANVNAFRQTSSDGGPSDPVVGFVWGNNSFASGITRSTGQGGNNGPNERTAIAATLNLAPGQSASLMYFAFLASDLTDRSGDNALALSTVNALFNSPNLSGLSGAQQARILNFGTGQPSTTSGTPEPSTALLTLGGLAGLAMLRRRRS